MKSDQRRARGGRDGELSRSTTRIGLLVAIPLAVVFGIQAIAWAVPKVWTHGETLTADDLNHNFKAVDDAVAAVNQPSPWLACGVLEDLRTGAALCELDKFPVDQYEYGFRYNSHEVHVADCLDWNFGLRVVNRHPYMVNSDDPTDGTMGLGGAMFYAGTHAADDDTPAACAANTWRHHYWKITGGNVTLIGSNGCFDWPLFCRRR